MVTAEEARANPPLTICLAHDPDPDQVVAAAAQTTRVALFALEGLLKVNEGAVIDPDDVRLVRDLVQQADWLMLVALLPKQRSPRGGRY